MTASIVESLTTYRDRADRERLGHLIEQLDARCDREGLDRTIRRVACTSGVEHSVRVWSPRSGEWVGHDGADLAQILDGVLDELNRRELS